MFYIILIVMYPTTTRTLLSDLVAVKRVVFFPVYTRETKVL